jgi:peptide deformylase
MTVRVTAVELDGTPVVFEAAEFLARILQHETDHVNGILFIDRLSTEDRKEAMRLIRESDIGLAGSSKADPSRVI